MEITPESIGPAIEYEGLAVEHRCGETMPIEACDVCRFWRPQPEFAGGHGFEFGSCRRHSPPCPVFDHNRSNLPDVDRRNLRFTEPNFYAHWPLTYYADWCGEFEKHDHNFDPTRTVDEAEANEQSPAPAHDATAGN